MHVRVPVKIKETIILFLINLHFILIPYTVDISNKGVKKQKNNSRL